MGKSVQTVTRILLLVALIAGMLPAGFAAASTAGMAWPTDSITAYAPSSGGVWYPRLLKLNNGD